MEPVTDGFAIQSDIYGQLREVSDPLLGQANGQTATIEADDRWPDLLDQNPATIELLLQAPVLAGDERINLAKVDRIEQLREQPGTANFTGLVTAAGLARGVALGHLFAYQTVEDRQCACGIDRSASLAAGGKGRSTATVGDIDNKAFANGFNAGLVNFVGVSLAIIQGEMLRGRGG